MRGSPGTRASATPASTSTIEGAVLSRRAIRAAATSTARRTSRIWIVSVIVRRAFRRQCSRRSWIYPTSGEQSQGKQGGRGGSPALGGWGSGRQSGAVFRQHAGFPLHRRREQWHVGGHAQFR